jgi:hypothetical protein
VKPTCQTCVYFKLVSGASAGRGVCKRRAPVRSTEAYEVGRAVFPEIASDGWCGEYAAFVSPKEEDFLQHMCVCGHWRSEHHMYDLKDHGCYECKCDGFQERAP